MRQKKLFLGLFILTCNVFYMFSQQLELPIVMFVSSETGLRIRSEPTTDSVVKGLLLFGERIIVRGKSDNVDTIDSITDYWYRIRIRSDEQNWIFGGYISEKLPENLPIILGLWDDINSPFVFGYFREGYRFSPNYDFSFSRKETGYNLWGSWEINDNIIRLFNLRPSDDYLAVHGRLNYTEDKIQIRIIDNNNIVLIFSDNRIVELRRSPDLWW